jgi:hypothetical protein
MAAELARYGLLVRLIGKNTGRTDKSKALVLWARTLELIDRNGHGLHPALHRSRPQSPSC